MVSIGLLYSLYIPDSHTSSVATGGTSWVFAKHSSLNFYKYDAFSLASWKSDHDIIRNVMDYTPTVTIFMLVNMLAIVTLEAVSPNAPS